jgi:hypothetical protein
MLGKILVTIFFPVIALLDWTISNYPLRDFWKHNRDAYNDFMKS